MTETKTLLRMGALALMWGSSFFWIKLGLHAFSPVQLVLGRLLLGATVLLLLCLLNRHRLPSDRRLWFHLAVAGLFHCALPFLLFAIGEQTVDSGITGVINATTPLWALLAAVLWRMEKRMSAAKGAGLLLGLAGTVLIFAPWQASGLLSWGALACLAASASYGFAFVYEERNLSRSGSSPVVLAGTQMLLASGFLVLAMPVGGTTPVHFDLGAFVAVAVLGVFSTGIAFAMNYRLLETEGAVATSTVGYLLPVVSVLLGSLLLSEQLDLRVLAGMVVVLAGVALTRVRRRTKNPVDLELEPVPVEPAPAK
ncbi:DMT family transporter [Amycolatopsis magusensis]|uniref:Drug/metabolite transporter (DMT)-like permease n=1 Tax=Amycolatopsis magusensis TaxID=882444 RepID=A0ABS4PMB3_9PSEU|nr:DMT family transporter [Amycolatopsis magusensis]MBP2180558.1 drug/metabolite transporter (DMT)-like permease [Amycolatopsis magusensis]MDI5974721.1 DMT family transporter [Amycolatopsis magusensis]